MNIYSPYNHRSALKLFAFILALAQMGPGVARVAAYDLSADFSPVSDPSGPWQYGAMTNLSGSFMLFTVHQSASLDNGVPVDYWVLNASTALPQIWRNGTTNTAISDGGQGVYPPGTVLFHPSNGTGDPYMFAVARFTAPPAGGGSYLLQTTAHTYLNGPTSDADFHVVVNGIQLFGQFMPSGSGTNYTTTLNLSVGDTIDFVVGRGLDGNGDYSGAIVQATLTSTFCSPQHAVATPVVVNGFVVGANILDAGCGYTNAPLVLIQGGSGSGATATATISGGQVTDINIINPGSGYTNAAPKILIASPPFVPTVDIGISKIKVTQHVVLGLNYVLEASSNLINWTATGPSFTATNETIVTEFDVDLTGRYFRIRQVP
jgi:hypothetical protein